MLSLPLGTTAVAVMNTPNENNAKSLFWEVEGSRRWKGGLIDGAK